MSQKLVQDENGEFVWVDARKVVQKLAGPKPVEGWAMGCIESQLEETRAAAKLQGFGDIEWVEDDQVPGFYNCRAPNAERHDKYAEKCGYVVKNGQFEGKRITKDELESAEKLIRDRYPIKEAA
jgi:hypothetical protein